MPRVASVSALEPNAENSLLNTEHVAARCTFPRCRRLTTSVDYRSVFADRISVTGQHWVLLARSNGESAPRLGLAVAKKHLKRAVDRNRIKRIIRESFRLRQHALGGVDIVVLVRRDIDLGEPKLLRRNIDAMWATLNRKCKKLSQP